MEPRRIELLTSYLQGRRSNHLSYDPINLLDTGRNRTDIFPDASRVLCQLSYRPKLSGYWSELNRHLSSSQLDALPIKLQTHTIAIAYPVQLIAEEDNFLLSCLQQEW